MGLRLGGDGCEVGEVTGVGWGGDGCGVGREV